MARIKIQQPGHYIASVSVPVRITDINYGNHVGNDAFVAIIHESRMQWLRQLGYTELNVEGIGLIMSDLAVDFKNESFYGDRVEVKMGIGEITRVSFELIYQLSATRNEQQALLAHARTTMVCYDYATKKVVAIPEKMNTLIRD